MALRASASWFLCLVLLAPALGQMQYPLSAACTSSGPLFVADRNLPGVWKIENGTLTTYFQGTKTFRTPLNAVRCLALDAEGRLLAGDSSTREVYRFDAEGKPLPLTSGGIGTPMAIAVNRAGDLLVADLELHRIYRVPAAGGEPQLLVEVTAPRGLFADAEDRLWIVSGGTKDQLQRVDASGKLEVVLTGRPFQFPHNVVVDSQGTAFVSDGYAKAIWKVPAGGSPVKWVSGDPLKNPVGLAWRGEALLVVDPHARSVFEVSAGGKISAVPAAGGG